MPARTELGDLDTGGLRPLTGSAGAESALFRCRDKPIMSPGRRQARQIAPGPGRATGAWWHRKADRATGRASTGWERAARRAAPDPTGSARHASDRRPGREDRAAPA